METLNRNEQAAMLRFAADFCFALVLETSKRTALVGTASLLQANSEHYLVSAAHVMKLLKVGPNNIGVPLGEEKAPVLTLGSMAFAIPHEDRKFDIGVARLDCPKAVTELKKATWKPITPADLGKLDPRIDTFVFVGFPRDLSDANLDRVLSGRLLAISPIYRTKTFEELNKTLPGDAIPFDERIDILLEYPRLYLKADGQKVDRLDLDLSGISGSPVWAVSGDASLSPEKRLTLVGIVTACVEGEFLLVKRWSLIAQAFSRIDPVAAKEMLTRV
jgi:hypothetical protein